MGSWATVDGDCDDNEAKAYPGNTEICDGINNDCDANTPEPGANTYYRDADMDGFGDPMQSQTNCGAAPMGYVANNQDCNDGNKDINPNAIEVCDGVDNNCVNGIDEGPVTVYTDGDGFGDMNAQPELKCAVLMGYADNNSDCNDNDKDINPNATEIPGNQVDENCDGNIGSGGLACFGDSIFIDSTPGSHNGFLGGSDPTTGGPRGNGHRWDDVEFASMSSQPFTVMYGSRQGSNVEPYLYLRGPNSCAASAGIRVGTTNGQPKRHQTVLRVPNPADGYYTALPTTIGAGQTGTYELRVVPGTVGTTCGGDSSVLFPVGFRSEGCLSVSDTNNANTPIPNGRRLDDYEMWLEAGKTYTVAVGGSALPESLSVASAANCGTSVGTSLINYGGRAVRVTPSSSGIYAAFPNGSSNATGAYTLNVLEGTLGRECFVGAGSVSGNGDNVGVYPAKRSSIGTLALTDRIGDFGTRAFDDFETYLESGQQLTVAMTRTTGSYTPRIYITRAGACTSVLASSTSTASATKIVSYTATTAGIYTIVLTSTATNQTGNYNYAFNVTN